MQICAESLKALTVLGGENLGGDSRQFIIGKTNLPMDSTFIFPATVGIQLQLCKICKNKLIGSLSIMNSLLHFRADCSYKQVLEKKPKRHGHVSLEKQAVNKI